ncbi:MAG: hypothetical protein KJO21_04725 [Verrucomicrobiae bacterium]|nr:hypothetical protein [Verrucomicrobiae bacterium]NNJ43026.1 hypothetical protein [Akkermansiaceae bacterium]
MKSIIQVVVGNKGFIILGLVVSLSQWVSAGSLPIMTDHPWIGYFSGYERRGFEFGIREDGQCEVYLIASKTKKRIGMARTINIQAEVIVEDDQGRRTTQKLKKGSLSTEMKAGADHRDVRFKAESTGGAKFEVRVEYDGNRIMMDGRILDRGSIKGEKIYMGFCVKVPAMYGKSTYDGADEKKVKAAMRSDRIRMTRADDRKRVSLKSYEFVDLQDKNIALGGVTELYVSMKSQEGNDFIFTTEHRKGVIDVTYKQEHLKAPMWKGYLVKWRREFTDAPASKKPGYRGGAGNSPLVIEFR